jgi:hypothetical protein
MSQDGARYLILLNHSPSQEKEWELWGFGNNVVAVAHNDNNSRHSWNASDWLNLEKLESQPSILVYCDYPLPGRKPQCKKKLYDIVGSEFRIWHHGGLNVGDASLENVWKTFRKQEFETAGFTRNAQVMPFSETSPYPWKDDIAKVKGLFASPPTLSFQDALRTLHAAWNKANAFFHVEGPAQGIIEALFPLYVDLLNRSYSSLSEADFQSALNTAKEDVASALSTMELTPDTLREIWGDVSDEAQKRISEPGLALLEAMDSLSFERGNYFPNKFKALSIAYTAVLIPPLGSTSPGLTDPEPS